MTTTSQFPPRLYTSFVKDGKTLATFSNVEYLSMSEHNSIVERLREDNRIIREALLLCVSRGATDKDHDWVTCQEPSCIMARAVLEKVKG